jgi:RNA polymerase sigma-70 factor (ECF subfamily)
MQPASEAIDDQELVRRTMAGEVEAYGRLVERHQAAALRLARRLVGPDEAEDVVQDAFVRAFHKAADWRGEAPWRVWLLRIVHSTAVNALARRRPAPVAELPEDAAPVAAAPGGPTPAAALEAGERRARLELKIGTLRPSHRAVLVLRDLQGLSLDEVAEVTDMPLGSVKGRLHRARQELAELLRNNTYDWEVPR